VALAMGNFCMPVGTSTFSEVIEIKKVSGITCDGNVNDPEWMNATLLNFNFSFVNGQSYRATVFLGHNGTHFFVGVYVFHVGPNPFSVPDKVTRPDGFFIYFDVSDDGKLAAPEDAKGLLNFLVMYHGQIFGTDSTNADDFWEPMEDPETIKYWRERRPEINEPVLWSPDENAGENVEVFGHGEYTNLDETFEFCFPLNSNDTLADGLHIKTGEAKTMGFALEFYRQGYYLENGTAIPDLYDLWPGEGFTPNVLIDASQYAQMHIDLGKPNNSQNVIRWLPVVAIITIAVISAMIFIFLKKAKKSKSERP
jgi:hypothetical protein